MGEETTRISDEIESLRHMTVGQLKAKHREVFGEETRSNHKQFLFRRIAWRIQANARHDGGPLGRLSAVDRGRCSSRPDLRGRHRRPRSRPRAHT